MLSKFYKITSLLLLVNLFLASTGVVVVKHRCKMRGERVFLFAKPADICCSQVPNSEECSLQAPACCLEQTQIHKISVDFQIHLQSLVLAEPLHTLVKLLDYKSIFLPYILKTPAPVYLFSPPPLPAGKELLTYLATFLI